MQHVLLSLFIDWKAEVQKWKVTPTTEECRGQDLNLGPVPALLLLPSAMLLAIILLGLSFKSSVSSFRKWES